jgi:hypothetical protein
MQALFLAHFSFFRFTLLAVIGFECCSPAAHMAGAFFTPTSKSVLRRFGDQVLALERRRGEEERRTRRREVESVIRC